MRGGVAHELASWKVRRRTASARRSAPASALRTANRISSRSNGLSTKSAAPAFMASTASGTVPCAVSMSTGSSGQRRASCASSAMPSMPGIRRSVMTRSNGCASTAPSASAPESTCRGVEPGLREQRAEHLAHRRVVVHRAARSAFVASTLSPQLAGSRIRTTVPTPTRLVKDTSPPCASATRRTNARPSPLPVALVV